MSGSAREFYTTYGNHGGERYHVAFADDENATNFVYDAWVYLTDSAANIANLEMDLNQTMPNGQTVIFGFQCDGYSGTWDYNANWTGPTTRRIHGCTLRLHATFAVGAGTSGTTYKSVIPAMSMAW